MLLILPEIILLIIKMTSTVTFITNPICPFAHRVWLTLLQKKVDFQKREASLTNKEAWFSQIYSKAYASDPKSNGKVPVLIHGNKTIAESDLISWYLAESFPTGTSLIPEDPFERLRVRRFIQEVPGKLISAFYSTMHFSTKSQQEQKAVIQGINTSLQFIQNEIVGPYALGEQFTLADILIYPWFARWCVNESYHGIYIPKQLTKINEFIRAVQARPSVQQTKLPNQFFLEGYQTYK